MTTDPIVEEVRAVRDEIARERGYDIDAIFEHFRQLGAASGRQHVSLEPRRVMAGEGAVLMHAQTVPGA